MELPNPLTTTLKENNTGNKSSISRFGLNSEQNCSHCGKKVMVSMVDQVYSTKLSVYFFCDKNCKLSYLNTHLNLQSQPKKITKKLAILNHKGGTGKTTTSISLAAGLALRNYKVLLLDIDAQGNVAVSLGIDHDFTIMHFLLNNFSLNQCVVKVRENLDLIISNDTLAAAELELIKFPRKEMVISDRLGKIYDYDFIIFDCAPSLNLLNQNALIFADEVIIPASCDYLGLIGVKQVLKNIQNINKNYNKNLVVGGIIPTFFDSRNNLSHLIIKNLKELFNDKILPPVRVNIKLKEAPRFKKTIFELAPDSNGALDYSYILDKLVDQYKKH